MRKNSRDGGPMLARRVLIQLSAAERIFSLLTNSSNERQNSYLGIIAET